MQYLAGVERNQSMLLPATVEEYVSAENPVRAIDAVHYTGDFGSGNLLGGNDVVLQAIPEPTTLQTLVPPALFLLGMLRLRRRI